MATAEPVVRATGLVVRRSGNTILDNLTFGIARGQVTGLLGPSGCGKTTLMRTLVGVQRITAGEVSLLGLPAGHPGLRARIGYTTQDPAVYSDLTLNENLRYFGTVLGLSRRRLDEVITRSEEHTSELQSRRDLVCRLLLEKKKKETQKNKQEETKTPTKKRA